MNEKGKENLWTDSLYLWFLRAPGFTAPPNRIPLLIPGAWSMPPV